MEKVDKSLLKLESKIGNFNKNEHMINNLKINKPNMNIKSLTNKYNNDKLLSFLNDFKKANEKMMNDNEQHKYNIEEDQEESEEEEENEDKIKNESIKLDEKEENKISDEKKIVNKKKNKIELDLLMGILEQQKPKDISVDEIIKNKKNENNEDIPDNEKEIIDFLINKKE